MTAFLRRGPVRSFATTRAALLAPAGHFIHGRPGAPLRFGRRCASLLVAFGNVLGLALLLVRVLGLLSAWHRSSLLLDGVSAAIGTYPVANPNPMYCRNVKRIDPLIGRRWHPPRSTLV